jgi:glycosyl transferase family 87
MLSLPPLTKTVRAKWSLTLWMMFLVLGLAGSWLISVSTGDQSTAAYGLRYLHTNSGNDSWSPMFDAIKYLHTDSDIPIYEKTFFTDHIKFQYPISSLVPLDLLQRRLGATRRMIIVLLNQASWWCVIVTGITTWLLLRGSYSTEARASDKSNLNPIGLETLIPMLAITMTFYPLTKSYTLGQVQTAITMLVALALLMWQRKWPGISGFLLGLCCAIKPQWAAVFLWGGIRKEWSMVVTGIATFISLTLASIRLYGFQNYVDYLPVMSYLTKHGEGYFPNQSINGLMNRLLFNGNNLAWRAYEFPPFHPLIYATTVVTALLLIGAALLWRMNKKANTLDLALFILSLTIASPIAWEHHYAILLPIFFLLAPICISRRIAGKYTNALLLAVFFLISQRFGILRIFADTYLNVLQSYLFFGALIILGLLYRATYLNGSMVRPADNGMKDAPQAYAGN